MCGSSSSAKARERSTISPWRQVLAEVFDMTEYLPALGTLSRIEIGFAGAGDPPPPACLLTGWLATRLGWTFQKAGRGELVFRSGARDVTVALRGTGSA